jgi:hypothetical protein
MRGHGHETQDSPFFSKNVGHAEQISVLVLPREAPQELV